MSVEINELIRLNAKKDQKIKHQRKAYRDLQACYERTLRLLENKSSTTEVPPTDHVKLASVSTQ